MKVFIFKHKIAESVHFCCVLGLRALKVGEQCEAIVKFPSLFERFPFPILINSAFLKLADTFRTG